MVLVILAVMWVVVLVPPLLRSRQDGRPSDSVVSFRRQLSTLQRTGSQLRPAGRLSSPVRVTSPSRGGYAPVGRAAGLDPRHAYGAMSAYGVGYAVRNPKASAARRRRQNILFTLAAVAGGSLLLAVASASRTFWYVHVVADVLLLGYVYLLVQMRKLAEQRDRTLRPVWYSAA